MKELKGFEKVVINPGEAKKVIFKISEPKLRFYTADMKYESEAGRFKVFVGRSSNGVATLYMDGKSFIALAGELHNSSS